MAPRNKTAPGQAEAGALARLVPTQQRSRERFERILVSAAQVMAEKGSEAFRMSDIVERLSSGSHRAAGACSARS